MLRCPPSQIQITVEDIDEAKHKFVLASAARSRSNSTKPHRLKALPIKPILTSAAYELKVKNGPGRARDDAIVSESNRHIPSSALPVTEDESCHEPQPPRRTRHSVYARRRDQIDTPNLRRSRSHSTRSGRINKTGVDLLPLSSGRSRPITHTGQRDSPSVPLRIRSKDSHAESIEHTGIWPDARAAELAETIPSLGGPVIGDSVDKRVPTPLPCVGAEWPNPPTRRSSLSWKKADKDYSKPSSESLDGSTSCLLYTSPSPRD